MFGDPAYPLDAPTSQRLRTQGEIRDPRMGGLSATYIGRTLMPTLISAPKQITVPGGKIIDEYAGRVNTAETQVSIAHMRSPAGWSEPGQRPDFDEFTVVLGGWMRVEYESGVMDVKAGQAVVTRKGEWVRYSTPDGAEYVAICLPAFSPDTVHRDE